MVARMIALSGMKVRPTPVPTSSSGPGKPTAKRLPPGNRVSQAIDAVISTVPAAVTGPGVA
jgi:hypothetical protein